VRVRALPGGVRVAVRLTPKGGRDAVEGWDQSSDGLFHLKARVRAVPEDGKANEALLALLAKTFALPKSALHLASGATARLKQIEIAGDPKALAAKLESFKP